MRTLDFEHLDPRHFAVIDTVVSSLAERTSIDAAALLLVGAEARNIIHAALGHDLPLRRTSDVDLGLATSDWGSFVEVTRSYTRTGSNGIRYMIDGVAVDMMPFGGIENPSGVSTPPSRGEDLVVFGFQDAFDHSLPLLLPSGITVRIPSVAGYAALKMRAFLDRSSYDDKDAQDLALAVYWYHGDESVDERVWTEQIDLLFELESDVDLVKAVLLGTDVAATLSSANRADLRSRWASVDSALLLRGFTFGHGDPARRDLSRRRLVIDHLTRGFTAD